MDFYPKYYPPPPPPPKILQAPMVIWQDISGIYLCLLIVCYVQINLSISCFLLEE
jgi:hypothetical protein